MTSVCLYFKVHQPYRLKRYEPEDISTIHCYEDIAADQKAIHEAAAECYLPANEILLQLLTAYPGRFRVSFSISGSLMELLEQYRPDVIVSFKKLVDTGSVEILGETFYHSLSFLHSKQEFRRQVEKHTALVTELFGAEPVVFRNTELIYNNELAILVSAMGFSGVLCEGVERLLNGRSPNRLYAAPGTVDTVLFLRNSSLSDDIAFRFDDPNWSEYPLTAEKFADWLHGFPDHTEVINLFLDYETFGIHKKKESGIFDFLRALPAAVLAKQDIRFATPSDLLKTHYPRDLYDVDQPISWEDRSDAACVYVSNTRQQNTLKKIYSIENMVLRCNNPRITEMWGRLQAAEHFYYMANDPAGNIPNKYPSPYPNAAEAFRNYSDILLDFEISLIKNNVHLERKRNRLSLPAFNLY